MDDDVKAYKTYEEQIEILASRGMVIDDLETALNKLRRVNYYRLSGYWYPFRQISSSGHREDTFFPGTRFSDVAALYDFDYRLRATTFTSLVPIELAMRSLLAHELGRIDPHIHLDPSNLSLTVSSHNSYQNWVTRYKDELARSREDFVAHHRARYGGRLPVWAAVELMDWGSLTKLYSFSPRSVQNAVASECGLTARQLESWLRALNLIRNTCAHHGRLFNRAHTFTPRLPLHGTHHDIDELEALVWSKTFGQLTLIQFLSDRLRVGNKRLLPAVLRGYPDVTLVPISHIGAPPDWESTRLWSY